MKPQTRDLILVVAWLGAWAFGLIAEALIQVHSTGVRPHFDGRGWQTFGLLLPIWAWGGGRSLERGGESHKLGGAAIGAAVALLVVVGLALGGHSLPPKAGGLLLMGSGFGWWYTSRFGHEE